MIYLVLYGEIKEESFFKDNFKYKNLLELFIGAESYGDLLDRKLEAMSEYVVLKSDKKLLGYNDLYAFIKQNADINASALKDSSILYFDLANFITDFSFVNQIFKKIQRSKYPATFYIIEEDRQRQYLDLYQIPFKILEQQSESTAPICLSDSPLNIDFTNAVVNLYDMNVALDILHSNFQLRFFNTLKPKNRYYVKSSANKEKIYKERQFLGEIPNQLKPYYPQVGEYSEEGDVASYEIEKICLIDVARQLVGSGFADIKIFKKLLHSIKEYFVLCPTISCDQTRYNASFNEWFVDKLRNRFSSLAESGIVATLDRIAQLSGFSDMQAVGDEVVEEMRSFLRVNSDYTLTYSHGDLCFSNILFDPKSGFVKFIDPKGYKTDISQTYAPIYYDLAKLSHSIFGLYDLMIYNLYEIRMGSDLKLQVDFKFSQATQEQIQNEFRTFLETLNIELRFIRLFEASLFLSMLPFHLDDQRRVCAQFLQGIAALNAYRA